MPKTIVRNLTDTTIHVAADGCPNETSPLSLADIKSESRLGGLLKHFYRQAA